MHLEGTPSDDIPDVLAEGSTDARFLFVSFAAREPAGRDADYIAWHSLDHRPEQYRLSALRNALRFVSTPACRAVRAAAEGDYAGVDHIMTYMFTDGSVLSTFTRLGQALYTARRMPLLLPGIGNWVGDLTGKLAAPRAVAGADVMPWRPMLGVYLLIEEGYASPTSLSDVPGVAGIWWYDGDCAPHPYRGDARGQRISLCFLDEDPVAVGAAMANILPQRWREQGVTGLLAAPFFAVVPFAWDLHLP